jgi:hypothetical protein
MDLRRRNAGINHNQLIKNWLKKKMLIGTYLYQYQGTLILGVVFNFRCKYT